ncbi:MAG: hypothetical protein HY924_15500 [Elusimicrobia bacterium]|nr:hypothetical protein [Elusimicrobiota bacterium]
MSLPAILLALALGQSPLAGTCSAAESYGARGIFPVYEVSGQWVIYDKKNAGKPKAKLDSKLKTGGRWLVVGSAGAAVFTVQGSTAGSGAACKDAKPLKLRAAVLEGDRKQVGTPVIGIQVPPKFHLKGPVARPRLLRNQAGEETYRALLSPLKAALSAELASGELKAKPDEESGKGDPAVSAAVKIDFGAAVTVTGLADAYVLVEGSQVAGTYRRCLRLADLAKARQVPGGRMSSDAEGGQAKARQVPGADKGALVGTCAVMRHELLAETARLDFLSYELSGRGKPLILAYTPSEPLWGHERWGFALTRSGPRLFLSDAMDIRCRESF